MTVAANKTNGKTDPPAPLSTFMTMTSGKKNDDRSKQASTMAPEQAVDGSDVEKQKQLKKRKNIVENYVKGEADELDEDEQRMVSLETRVLRCERASGLTDPRSPFCEKMKQLITFRVNSKLMVLGWSSMPIAVLAICSNFLFLGFFINQQLTGTCTPNVSLIDGDLPAFANQMIFKGSNTHVCTTGYQSSVLTEVQGSAANSRYYNYTCSRWTPCQLNGLTPEDYDLDRRVCPVSYNGCYRHQGCEDFGLSDSELPINATTQSAITTKGDIGISSVPGIVGMLEVCDSAGFENLECRGVVSITYYSCPSAGTVVGAALGYTVLVQMAAVFILIPLYLLLKFIFTGSCYRPSDFAQAIARPGTSIHYHRRSRLEKEKAAAAAAEGEGQTAEAADAAATAAVELDSGS